MLELDVAYRLAEGPRGFVDAYVGARYNYINVEVTTVLTTARVPVLVTNSSDTKQWADPLIGIRGQYNFNDKWFARGRLDVGGFNLVSNVTFQGSISAGYNFNQHLFAELGYRYLLTDYEDGGFTYNLASSGMFLGLGIKF
jgi:opacity protein-like surface antigen